MRCSRFYLLFLAVGLISICPAADESAALPPSFVWQTISNLVWKTYGSARIEDGILTASLESVGDSYAQAEIDLSGYDGRPFELSATVRTEGIAEAEKPYLGYRFAVNYLDMSMGGNRTWPGGPSILGDFGPAESVFVERTDKVRRKAYVQIGICRARGKVTCDLSTLRIREPQPLVPKRNAGYKVRYPDRVKNLPRMRGVMLGGMNDEAWDNLQSWGANLVRYQFAIPGAGPVTNFEAYASAFRANTLKELDNITRTLDNAQAHGMMVVLDAHYACGGGCSPKYGDPLRWTGDWRIFHDTRYAELFLWSWQKIAERCRGRTDVVYGYDLMNEAHHKAPAVDGYDLVGLQERIARAIREIDPDTTIIVESMYCDPGWFRSLSAIGLDNVIYQVHLYYPHDYTHQGILTPLDTVYEWPDALRGWNRDFLMRSLKPVIDFQREHDAKIFVGEFSAIAWAPNAAGYIEDCISIFEELGWDWTYHAYREFHGWNVEKEAISRGRGSENFRPSTDNPRMRVLKAGLKGDVGADRQLTQADYKIIDLLPFCNRSWSDSPSVRGWNETPGCLSLKGMPDGEKRYHGIPFRVRNSGHPGTPELVMLSSSGVCGTPRSFAVDVLSGAPVGALAVLHAAGYISKAGQPHGKIVLHFADGSCEERVVVSRRDISDWYMGLGGPNAACAWKEGGGGLDPMRVFVSVFPLERCPVRIECRICDSPDAQWMIGGMTLLSSPPELPPWNPPVRRVYSDSSCAVRFLRDGAMYFENPVIKRNWSDPTIWQDEHGVLYSAASGLEDTLVSTNWIDWTSLGRSPIAKEARDHATGWGAQVALWAPDVVKVNDRWNLYCTCIVSSEKNRVAVFSSEEPAGPFEFEGFLLTSEGSGIPDLCVDPEVVVDGADVWLFCGSVGGVHRVRLATDGLSVVPGASPDRVTCARVEGGYLFSHEGWWYLFGSRGQYNDWSYHICCARAKKLDGIFMDRHGRKALDGFLETVLSSAKTDVIDGPGHNGEIYVDASGRSYMFYHAHLQSRFPRDDGFYEIPRPTFLQELTWVDGWPVFSGGRPALQERMPNVIRADGS